MKNISESPLLKARGSLINATKTQEGGAATLSMGENTRPCFWAAALTGNTLQLSDLLYWRWDQANSATMAGGSFKQDRREREAGPCSRHLTRGPSCGPGHPRDGLCLAQPYWSENQTLGPDIPHSHMRDNRPSGVSSHGAVFNLRSATEAVLVWIVTLIPSLSWKHSRTRCRKC